MDLIFFFIAFASFGLFFFLSFSGVEVFSHSFKKYEERYLARTAGLLDEMFLSFSPEQVFYLNIAAVAVLFFAAFLVSGSVFFGGFLGMFGYFVPRMVFSLVKRIRKSRLESQLVDVIDSVSNSLKAGFSLIQALELVAREGPQPISQEIGLLVRESALGMNFEDALRSLGARIQSQDFDLVITAVLIARSVGGNLAETFQKLGSTIRQRNAIQGKIKALTAQGKMQGVVIGSLPLVLGCVLYCIEPGMILTLFRDPLGWAVITAIIGFEAIGAFFIWKIVTIDV